MVISQAILRELEQLEPVERIGNVFRFVLGDRDPWRENVSGARWNPPTIAAVYTALERDTVLAESDYVLSSSPARSNRPLKIYTLWVGLNHVLDIRDELVLRRLGITGDLATVGWPACQEIGGGVHWLRHEGLLVPSARRAGGSNLVIFPNNCTDLDLDTVSVEVL